MQIKKNIPYYLIAAGLFVLLKIGFRLADNDDLAFLLKPTDKLVGLLTGSHSVYLPDSGYYHEKTNIIIDKSCSGFNFWVLGFLLFTYLFLKHFDSLLGKSLAIPTALIGAYLLTVIVNTSRVFASIIVRNQTESIFPNQQPIIHETIGITTILTFLILAYILMDKLLINKRRYAKST